MRAKIFSVLLVIFLGTYSVNGQVPIFENNEETARRLDALEGRDTPERRETPDPNRNNNDSERNNELRERWDELFGGQMAAFKEGMEKFDTPETRCIYIMVIYLDTYLDLVEKTNETDEVETICDGYALQLMALTASTSIMYCPEGLSNKSGTELHRIYSEDLLPILRNEDNNEFVSKWNRKFHRVLGLTTVYSDDFYLGDHDRRLTRKLIDPFKPEYIVNQLLLIQRHMQALNCPE